MWTRSRRGLAAAAIVLTLACACSSPPGRFATPKGQGDAVLNAALDDLKTYPFLSFTGTVDNILDGDTAEVDIAVADYGAAYGTLVLDEWDIGFMSVHDKYYVKADKDFWTDYLGESGSVGKRLNDRWTPIDPTDWFVAGSMLATPEYVEELRAALEEAHAFDAWLPEPSTSGDSRCLPIEVRDGRLCVSAKKPYRIVNIDEVPIASIRLGDNTGSLTSDLTAIDSGAVKSWHRDLAAAVKKLSTVYTYGGVSMSTSGDDFSCSGTTCTFKAKLGVEDVPEYQTVAAKAKVSFTGIAKTTSAGSETCTGSVTVKIGRSATATCSVTFNLKPGTSQNVTAEWESNGLLTFKPDTKAITKDLKSDVEDVLDRLP